MKLFRNWYWIFWLAAIIAAGWFYYQDVRPMTFVGVVEKRTHEVSSPRPGVIGKLLVRTGDRVRAGQALAEIRYDDTGLQFDNLRISSDMLRIEQNIRRELSELKAREAELRGLDAQISGLKKAEATGLLRSQNLAELTVRRDALREQIRAQLELLEKQAPGPAESDSKTPEDSAGQPVGQRQTDRLQGLRDRIAALEARSLRGTIGSPCNGHVVAVASWANDSVDAYQPFISVEEDTPTHLEAYLPEQSNTPITEGDRVEVVSNRPHVEAVRGTVTFVHPGFSPMPQRLLVKQIETWARKIYVELDPGHGLLPGERVKVKAGIRSEIESLPGVADQGDANRPESDASAGQARSKSSQ